MDVKKLCKASLTKRNLLVEQVVVDWLFDAIEIVEEHQVGEVVCSSWKISLVVEEQKRRRQCIYIAGSSFRSTSKKQFPHSPRL